MYMETFNVIQNYDMLIFLLATVPGATLGTGNQYCLLILVVGLQERL